VTSLSRPTLISESNATALIDAVLREAIACRASDVHFESDADTFRVRLRIDGVLQVIATPPLGSRDTVLTRLKVLARMDIAEKRLPQDGRFSHTQEGTTIDLRVSSLPTLHGEKLALRVLDLQQTLPKLDALGYEPDQLAHLQQALQGNHGLLLMTGPTGSGKTLSLYSCLQTLNRTEVNIHTLEDPIEVRLPGVNQVQMHERSGLGFSSTLRAVLRQDPDVIMLGEIRDRETADIALQAAQTGHLVLSTLHTADAPSGLARLQHMGMATHHIAASVRLIVAQRLVRRLCWECREPLSADAQQRQLNALTEQDKRGLHPWLTSPTHYRAQGCAHCHGGYRGRVGVFQVMPVSLAMQALLFDNAPMHTLSEQAARESVRSLRRSGWVKVLQGMTTLDEIMHHTPADTV
jgi:type IV pilus assembly protein PilB